MEEYYKGMAPLKNIRFLGIIDEEFFEELGETDKKYKITIEVEWDKIKVLLGGNENETSRSNVFRNCRCD